jgi:hypothetical protein
VWLLALVGMLLKEDLLAIVPVLLVLQAARRFWDPGAKGLTRSLLAAGAACCALLLTARLAVSLLPVLRFDEGWRYYWTEFRSAPVHVLVLAGGYRTAPGLGVSVMMTAAAIGGLALVARRGAVGRRDASVFITGAVVMAITNMPLMFVSGQVRQHLVALGATLVVTGGGWLMWRRGVSMAILGIAAAVLLTLSIAVSRERTSAFAPCGPRALRWYELVQDMPIPETLRRAYGAGTEACREGRDPRVAPETIMRAWRESRAPG